MLKHSPEWPQSQEILRQGDGLHFEPSGSFLKCVLVTNGVVKYFESSTIVVTLTQ